jgi:glyoxylase-like metal-dependent hydrolase (beta-lactamase superfamily II)
MEPQPQLVTVADGVHAWIGTGGDSNAGAFATPDGLVAIDAQQYPRLAQAFRGALASTTGRPVIRLIDTHCHLDHTAGNIVFADVPILAHANTLAALNTCLGPKASRYWTLTEYATKARLLFGQNLFELVGEDDPGQAWFRQRISLPDYDTMTIAPPTETFADTFELQLPDDVVRLAYRGPAHCDGDITVHIVRRKVIFLGDLLFYRRFPWLGDCDLDGWIDALAHVLTLDIEVVIPGHGPPTDLGEVARFRDMLAALRSAVEQAIRDGRSEEAAMREVRLSDYADLPRYKEWLPTDVKAVYRYLRGR